MFILTGPAEPLVRSEALLRPSHDADAGHVAGKLHLTTAHPASPLRRVPAAGNTFLLYGFKAAGFTKQEGKAVDKVFKSAVCAFHPVGKAAAEGLELFRSSHEAWSDWRDPDRAWVVRLRSGFGAAANLMDFVTAAMPPFKNNRIVRIFDDTVTLGEELCKLVEIAIGEETSSSRGRSALGTGPQRTAIAWRQSPPAAAP